MTEWTMNTSSLERGMFVRRPGLDESLEVVNVRNGQAKIKLPDGKTSTIPASAEVEWTMPGSATKAAASSRKTEPVIIEDVHLDDSGTVSEWQTDWTLLSPGIKISVLGEKGDFTILRLTDSSARIKHNATGQIQPLTIGHKFKVLDSSDNTKTGKAAKTVKAGKAAAEETKPAKPRKTRSDKGSKIGQLEIEDEIEDEVLVAQTILRPAEDEPSDEVLDAIENGDDDDETEIDTDEDINLDPESLEDLDDDSEDDSDQDTNTDDDNDDTEDDDMPAPAPATRKPSRSASTSLLTVGAISERTGISYPTLMRYIRDHGDRLPSEGEGRARRFLPEAIEVFKAIRAETKGGRPSSGKAANPRKPKPAPASNRPTRQERSHETAAPYAAPARAQAKAAAQAIGSRQAHSVAPSSTATIDEALAMAIDHARAQMDGLQSLIDNLEAQRESLKLWS